MGLGSMIEVPARPTPGPRKPLIIRSQWRSFGSMFTPRSKGLLTASRRRRLFTSLHRGLGFRLYWVLGCFESSLLPF